MNHRPKFRRILFKACTMGQPGRYSGTCQRPDGKTLSTFPFSFEEVLGSTVRCRYRCSLLLSELKFTRKKKIGTPVIEDATWALLFLGFHMKT